MTTALKELEGVIDNSNMKGVFNMKTKIKLNLEEKKITMTKAMAKKASYYGTEECDQLAEVMKKFPNFTIEIVSPKAKSVNNKGLTVELMEKLIKVMTNGNTEAIDNFKEIRDLYQKTNFHYSMPKKYFISNYPNWRDWSPQEAEEVEAQEAEQEQAAEIEEVEVEAQEAEQKQVAEQEEIEVQIEHKAAAVEEIKKKSLFGKYLNI